MPKCLGKRALLALALSLLLTSCSPRDGAKPSPSSSAAAAPIEVETVVARSAVLPEDISAVGTFQAISSVNISPKASGPLVSVPVHTGQFVPQGGVIMQQDTSDLEMAIRQDRADLAAEQTRLGLTGLNQELKSDRDVPSVRKARANLENARLQWERNRNLYRADLIAQKDLQDAKTSFLTAQADYQTAVDNVQTNKANVLIKRAQLQADELKLRNATVRAPFSGYVSSVSVDVGDYVTPGGSSGNSPYVTLLTLDPIYCQMKIGEINSQRLRLGQTVTMTTVAYPGKRFNGVVYRISPALDPATRTVNVLARISNPSRLLKPGLYGNVVVRLGTTPDVPLVPQMAQTERAGQTYVYVVEQTPKGPVARMRPMGHGRIDGNWIEASSADVKAGTQVVVSSLDRMYDGAPLTITRTLPQAPPVPRMAP